MRRCFCASNCTNQESKVEKGYSLKKETCLLSQGAELAASSECFKALRGFERRLLNDQYFGDEFDVRLDFPCEPW